MQGIGDHIISFVDDTLMTSESTEQHLEYLEIKPDQEKVQGIIYVPEPKNVKQLIGFLGLVNFYSKFSSRHAVETVSLLHLMKKGVPWKLDESTQKSFNRNKQLFCKTITLYFPDQSKEYYLETDANNYALGAIRYQKNDKQEKEIITLASGNCVSTTKIPNIPTGSSRNK